jgi:hypothetical protein
MRTKISETHVRNTWTERGAPVLFVVGDLARDTTTNLADAVAPDQHVDFWRKPAAGTPAGNRWKKDFVQSPQLREFLDKVLRLRLRAKRAGKEPTTDKYTGVILFAENSLSGTQEEMAFLADLQKLTKKVNVHLVALVPKGKAAGMINRQPAFSWAEGKKDNHLSVQPTAKRAAPTKATAPRPFAITTKTTVFFE